MPVFDFHCHPGMKSRLAPEGQEPSPWQTIRVQLEILKSIRINISPAFSDALDSQASLHQLWRGGVNLFGCIVYSIESHVAGQLLQKGIVRNGHILQLAPSKLQRSAAGNDYFNIMLDELDRLVNNQFPPASMGLPANTQLKFIRSMAEYERDNPNVLHAILILEGSQNLFNNPDAPDFKEQFIQNLDTLSTRFRLFAINPCHFQQQPIANQAFAMQFLQNDPFFPTDKGITTWGFEIIREIYRRGILIDIKHMGLHTRQELYRIRQEEGITLPLICSHTGVAGINSLDRLNYFYHESPQDEGKVWMMRFVKKWGHVKDTAYNMTSLQLYDDDIEEVIISGGMIGISMDQRIIGFPADEPLLYNQEIFPTDLEYISKLETKSFFGPLNPPDCPPRILNSEDIMDFTDAENQTNGNTLSLHAHYFINQILHILFVAKNSTRGITINDALKSICIGSDLDGLVNPLDCCLTTAQYPQFKSQLFAVMNKKSFWKKTGFASGELNVSQLLEDIFFNNAESFLHKHFT